MTHLDPSAAPDPLALATLAREWAAVGLPAEALERSRLSGQDPVFPSSFHVGVAAQVPIAAAGLASNELAAMRGLPVREVAVDMAHAAHECTGWFSLNGVAPDLWDAFSGLYACADGWVRVHANFAHHRDGVLRLLGLDPSTATRKDAESALTHWKGQDFEDAAAEAKLVVARLRSQEEWDEHPHGQALAGQPLFTVRQLDAASAPPRLSRASNQAGLPLQGLRVLDLTRILAGPVCGRLLARLGAEVMLVNSPRLPNIASIADTSRGKLSCHIDLHTEEGRASLRHLIRQSDVLVQGYRPGGLAELGFSAQEMANLQPGLVVVNLSAYGQHGPWANRRGFDSLVQTATGFNHAEMIAKGSPTPQAMPMQILDFATGHWMAFAAMVGLIRQWQSGGSWVVDTALAQTGQWLRSLGRVPDGWSAKPVPRDRFVRRMSSGFGELACVSSSLHLAGEPHVNLRPSMPPGSHPPVWPAGAD
jgi:crotonobetainyl-CoA:carnitine CoA-transferase CaiB-like acyl-CoA transferase